MFMKRRVSKILNFIAFNLLFFALYLNFVHKDSNATPVLPTKQHAPATTTVIAEKPVQVADKQNVADASKQHGTLADNTIALKLSFN